jgi:hypothetical protein
MITNKGTSLWEKVLLVKKKEKKKKHTKLIIDPLVRGKGMQKYYG